MRHGEAATVLTLREVLDLIRALDAAQGPLPNLGDQMTPARRKQRTERYHRFQALRERLEQIAADKADAMLASLG